MWKFILALTILFSFSCFAQDQRIEQLQNKIESIYADAPGLSEKVNINIKQANLADFLLAVSEIHKINISVAPSLSQVNIVNHFTGVTVADLLIFLCKEYNLTIEFTGNILAIKPYQEPAKAIEEKIIDVKYDAGSELISLNLKNDNLYDAFKRIMDQTGKNIVFSPGLEKQLLTAYILNSPFDNAMNKLAYANNLMVSKTRDNFYVFDKVDGNYGGETTGDVRQNRPQKARKSNFYFKVIDKDTKLLEVDFENTSIANIIYDIGSELGIDVFISAPLENAGNATVRASRISFDELLARLFEMRDANNGATAAPSPGQYGATQNAPGAPSADVFSFVKRGNIYYFGLKSQLLIRNIKTISLMHRSIELMSDPAREGRTAGRVNNANYNGNYTSYNGIDASRGNQNYQNQSNQAQTVQNTSGTSESILSIVPDEVKKDLDIKVDRELNSFIVNGPASNIERFENFINYIDKAVPVVLIEVMLLEAHRSSIVETGISAGIGDKPVSTNGTIFPNADITLGASTVNKIIDRFDGFGSLNVGHVIPDFYLSLKAQESNGNVKIRSAPRLSTLNGHKAYLSIGETTYYVVTNQNYYGSQIPQASETKNYQPIDAELSLSIMPLVSGDGQITMDIKVIQSSFNGEKVDKDAPPGINSREFTSIIRVKDQDLIVLGGLEEKIKNDSGTGIPLLSRIPIIKWLFSSRKRQDSKKKLTVLIKPTILY